MARGRYGSPSQAPAPTLIRSGGSAQAGPWVMRNASQAFSQGRPSIAAVLAPIIAAIAAHVPWKQLLTGGPVRLRKVSHTSSERCTRTEGCEV